MLFQGARLPARIDAAGELAILSDQDRSLWDQRMIREGMGHLDIGAAGDEVTTFHIEAGIAATHASAASFEATDWSAVLGLYEELITITSSPVVALNRAVALAMVEGSAAALAAAETIQGLDQYLPFAATVGELSLRAGEMQRAAACFARAMELPSSLPEKRFLLRKLEESRRRGQTDILLPHEGPPR